MDVEEQNHTHDAETAVPPEVPEQHSESLEEKRDSLHPEHLEDVSDNDSIADDAIGGDEQELMSRHYFRHWRLIGSMIVS